MHTQIVEFPEQTFGSVAETIVRAADIAYFNDPSCAPERAVDIRTRLVERVVPPEYSIVLKFLTIFDRE